MRGISRSIKRHKRVHANTHTSALVMDKFMRLQLSSKLYAELEKIADIEGREQGRPKSVSAVMRKALQGFVDARGVK